MAPTICRLHRDIPSAMRVLPFSETYLADVFLELVRFGITQRIVEAAKADSVKYQYNK